ncbi:MAG: WhiB family transcriptional regulator [Propionibacteriaceae bacterium]
MQARRDTDRMETPAMSQHPSTTPRGTITGCVQFSSLFQDAMLEEPPTASANAATRRRYVELESEAARVCGSCPLVSPCLYRAVVDHDVAGFVAGTTQKQRLQLRAELAVTVQPEDFDTLAGVARQHRQVDHAEVVRLRHANPNESLEQLAQRLGCSLSTVKRHLRSERQAPAPQAQTSAHRPSESQVWAAYRQLIAGAGWLRNEAA